jgi:hypothetical protein
MTDAPNAPFGEWDDSRLDRAYRAGFDVRPPAGLMDRVDGRLDPRPPSRWHVPVFAGTAIALVAVAAIVATNLGSIGPSALPSARGPGSIGPTTEATPSAAPVGLGWPFPDQVTSSRGDYVPMSISDAIRVRARDAAPTEIAVAGWQSNATDVRFCTIAFQGLRGQLENQCVYNRWLAERPEPTSGWYDPPVRPAIRLAGEQIWQPPILLKWGEPGVIHFRGGSVAVVVVGHFHDQASKECRSSEAQLCTETFVVDQIPWVLSTAGHRVVPNPVVAPMSVPEAIDVRDSGAANEIAVGGWFAYSPVPCPAIPDAQPPLESCIASFTWLMRDPEQLEQLASDGSGSIHPPVGPAISLVFDQATVPALGSLPEQMVLVGHFNDPRAQECPAGTRRAACAARFVIDEFLFVGDQGLPSPSP